LYSLTQNVISILETNDTDDNGIQLSDLSSLQLYHKYSLHKE